LVVTRQWRCLTAAATAAMGFMGLSFLVFGAITWRVFLHSVSEPRILILNRGLIPYSYQQSVFAAMRLWNVPLQASYVIQAVFALLAAAVLVWLWTGNFSYRLKAASLVICSLLATPYLFDYDLASLGIVIAFLALEGIERGFLPFEKFMLVAAWLAPFLDRAVATHARIPLCVLINVALLCLLTARAARGQGIVLSAPAQVMLEA
jgi:alpha-1,2-mannosyltransferase